VRVRVPRFDDWFRPVRRGGAPALVRHPSPRDRVHAAVAVGLCAAWAVAVVLVGQRPGEHLFLWGFPAAWALLHLPFLVRTRSLGWRGREPHELPPLGWRGRLAWAAVVLAVVAGYVVAGTTPRTASDDDCRFWAALSEDFSRPQVERDAARAAVEDLGCDG